MTERHWGVNLPLAGNRLHDHRRLIEALPDCGYSDVWTGEGSGPDAFTGLAAAAAWVPSLRLGTGVVPVSTRGPGVLVQTATALADLGDGELLLGIGSSVPAHVTLLNGTSVERPLARVRDMARYLRAAFHGTELPTDLTTFASPPEALPQRPARPPKVLVGALRPAMLQLAYDHADGAVVNLLLPEDLTPVLDAIGPRRTSKELVLKLFVCPTTETDVARQSGREFLGWILNQAPYAAFHQWLGRGDALAESRQRWQAGDGRGARAAVPDAIVDALWLHGDPTAIADSIARYLRPEVTTVVIYLAPTPELTTAPERIIDVLRSLRLPT